MPNQEFLIFNLKALSEKKLKILPVKYLPVNGRIMHDFQKRIFKCCTGDRLRIEVSK